MTDYSILVDKAQGHGEAARRAARKLGAAGVTALPAITDAVASPWTDPGSLPVALGIIYGSAPADVLADGLRSEAFLVFACAMRAAAGRTDEHARHLVLERLQDAHELRGRRGEAARVIGEYGDPALSDALRSALAEALALSRAADDPPVFAIETVTALAKLGDFEHGSYLVDLVRADGFSPTRSRAAAALEVAIGPGMVRALTVATADSATEVRTAAVRSLFLLRCRAAVDGLVIAATGDDPLITAEADAGIEAILGHGLTPTEPREPLAATWRRQRGSWDPATCYRWGTEFSTGQLLRALATAKGSAATLLRQELIATTGVRPHGEDVLTPDEAAEMTRRTPDRGGLYRWGHRIDPAGLS